MITVHRIVAIGFNNSADSGIVTSVSIASSNSTLDAITSLNDTDGNPIVIIQEFSFLYVFL